MARAAHLHAEADRLVGRGHAEGEQAHRRRGLAGLSAAHSRRRKLLDRTQEELEAGLAELRELAQGIHPAMLTEQGLAAAIEVLAARSALDVDVTGALSRRPRPAVESALYFTVAEALTNCAKHAAARTVRVSVAEAGDLIEVVVADDGRRGADLDGGSGLRGLGDRIAALGGTVDVASRAGNGTVVRARVPR